jgi:hypothetical protein
VSYWNSCLTTDLECIWSSRYCSSQFFTFPTRSYTAKMLPHMSSSK